MNCKTIFLPLLLVLFLAVSCKKEDIHQDAFKYINIGYMKGTITGEAIDGTKLNETFNYDSDISEQGNRFTLDSVYIKQASGTLVHKQIKNFFFSLAAPNVGRIGLRLNMDGTAFLLNTVDKSGLTNNQLKSWFWMYFKKQLDDNTILNYEADEDQLEPNISGDTSDSFKISNFVYDEIAGTISGNFIVKILKKDFRKVEHRSTVTGEFKLSIVKMLN